MCIFTFIQTFQGNAPSIGGQYHKYKAAPHNGARRFGQCFDTSESMENAGILDVFPIFHTARLGQKIRRSPLSPPSGVAIRKIRADLSTIAPFHGIIRKIDCERGLTSCLSSRKRQPVVLVCWPMCERIEEYHIFIALRSLDFSGLSCVFGIY